MQQVQQGAFGPGQAVFQLPAGQPATTAEQLLPALPYAQQGSPHQPQPMQHQPYAAAGMVCSPQQSPRQQQQQHGALGLPVSMSDLDLVAAVAEEVSVYDLQRQQELEHQQAAAAAAASRRASLAAAPQAEPPVLGFQQSASVGPAARRLSYQPPGIAPPSAGGLLAPLVSSSSSRPPSVAAPAAVPTPSPPAEGERRPVTAATALRQWGHLLTAFEQSEVLSYQHVWFVGRPGTGKIKGERGCWALTVCIGLASANGVPGAEVLPVTPVLHVQVTSAAGSRTGAMTTRGATTSQWCAATEHAALVSYGRTEAWKQQSHSKMVGGSVGCQGLVSTGCPPSAGCHSLLPPLCRWGTTFCIDTRCWARWDAAALARRAPRAVAGKCSEGVGWSGFAASTKEVACCVL